MYGKYIQKDYISRQSNEFFIVPINRPYNNPDWIRFAATGLLYDPKSIDYVLKPLIKLAIYYIYIYHQMMCFPEVLLRSSLGFA